MKETWGEKRRPYLCPDERQLGGGHGQGRLYRLFVFLGLLDVPSPLFSSDRSCHLRAPYHGNIAMHVTNMLAAFFVCVFRVCVRLSFEILGDYTRMFIACVPGASYVFVCLRRLLRVANARAKGVRVSVGHAVVFPRALISLVYCKRLL